MSDNFKYKYNLYERYGFPMINIIVYLHGEVIGEMSTMRLHEGENPRHQALRIAKGIRYRYERDREFDSQCTVLNYSEFASQKIFYKENPIQGVEVMMVED